MSQPSSSQNSLQGSSGGSQEVSRAEVTCGLSDGSSRNCYANYICSNGVVRGELTCDLSASCVSSLPGSSASGDEVKRALRGGYTCCVPGCYTNTKKNRELSFHKFPMEKSIREKWVNAIKRKNFYPSEHHHVYSQHFHGGKKQGSTDVPAIFPLLPQPKQRKAPMLRAAVLPREKKTKTETCVMAKPLADALVEEVSYLYQLVSHVDSDRVSLKQEQDNLKFGLQRFAGSDEDIRFYTGFPNYKTLTSFYEFLLPAATQLNYWGSGNADNGSENMKCGPSRKLQPIDELFMTLYRLCCNVLEKDIGDRSFWAWF